MVLRPCRQRVEQLDERMTIDRRQWIGKLVLYAPVAAFAQEKFRSRQKVEAKAIDVSGAKVKLKNVQTRTTRSYISQEGGDFQFTGLSTSAAYEIWAEHRGRSSDIEYLSRFDTEKVLRVEPKLAKRGESAMGRESVGPRGGITERTPARAAAETARRVGDRAPAAEGESKPYSPKMYTGVPGSVIC